MVGTVTFNQAMLAKDRVFAIRAGAYTSSNIKGASFNYGYISGDTFKPGGTVAGSAKLTFTSIITTFNKLDKIYPEIGLLVGDSYEWVAMGEYFVNDISIDRNRNTTELDLMDGMFKLNQPFVSDLTYPAQIRDVIREICVKTGVEVEEGVLALSTVQKRVLEKPDKKDITFREVLSQVIQLLGFSAFFNRQGKLEIRGLTESNITITADNYFLHGLSKSEVEYQIAGITCKKDKETLTVGLRTGRSLELENPLMSQEYLNDLYYDLKEIKYYPFSLDWQGHLKLDVGQWVTLKTNKNETYKVPVLSQSFSFKGGLKSKISADSKAGNDTQYSYKGFLTKQIEQMSTQIDAELQQRLEEADKELDRRATELSGAIEQVQVDAAEYADSIKQEISERLDGTAAEYQADKQSQLRQFDEWTKILAQKVSQADISVDPESGRIQLGTKEITAQNIASLLIMDKGVTTLLANKFYLGAPSENLIKLSPDYHALTKTSIDADGYYVNESTDNLFWLSNYEPNPIKRGDELKITGSIQSTKAQILRVEVYFFDKDKNRVAVGGSVSINVNSGGSLIDASLVIPEVPLTAKYYAITLVASNNTDIRAVRISNTQARIKTGVDMIVDGSITTALLNAAEGDFARLVAKFVQAEGLTAKVADIQSAKIGSLTVDNDAWMRKLVANRIITELLQAFVVQADKIVVPGTTRPVFTIDRDGNISIDTPILKVRGELLATQKDLETIELTPGPKGEKGATGPQGLQGPKGDQGIAGPKGTDGRTPYIHWAYSDSADGTGLTTSDNGQRYIGHYSDHTQVDSTDKTKYRWADRWAKIEVGGRNYIRDFGFANLGRLFTNASSWKFERVVDAMAKSGYHLKATCTGAGTGGMGADLFDLRGADWQGKVMTFAVDIKCSKSVRLKYGCEAFEDASSQLIDVTTAWKRYSSSSKVRFNRWHSFIFYNHTGRWEVGDVLYIRDPQLEDGSIPTTPTPALKDIQADLDSKADQALTQEQITALQERAKLAETELEAKASIDAVNELIGEYRRMLDVESANVRENQEALVEAAKRVAAIELNLGQFAERVEFLDSYMTRSNEGLIIGKNDGSALIRVSENRISMLSAGKEVMYISQGVIHIDNGIFTKSLQIGRFRTEQHVVNLDMNVIRYIG